MIITPITGTEPSFGYNHPLKTMFKKGQLPLKRGFYGDPINNKTVSLEHLLPVSKGGKTTLDNLVLASKQKNTERGNQPLSRYFNPEAFVNYINEVSKIKTKLFDGREYAAMIMKTVEKLLKNGD